MNNHAPNVYRLGASYYPEQWSPEQWADDFQKMRSLGFNTVRMGEFAWAFLEPAAGVFAFDWMDQAITLAASYGILTILCTPTASVPPWLRQAHPDVLGGNERGPYDYGGRKGYCVNSAALLAASDRVTLALARHYENNAAVIGWQLDNEPGHPFVCYDPNCLAAFRRWLQDRYQTTERLNVAWGGAFWSNWYTDWAQIEFALNTGSGGRQPGAELDYRRFFSDSFLAYLKRQETVLRPHLGDRFVFTNWPNMTWSVDTFEAAFLDAAAWDNYCPAPGLGDPREQFYSARNHDHCRNASSSGWFLLAEQSPQVPAHASPEGVRLQTYLDLAHGAAGTLFFEWRPPVAGAEQGYVSVLQMDGSFGPAEEAHRRTGAELARVGPVLAEARTRACVAQIFCYDNQWHQGFWSGPAGYDHLSDRWYKALKRFNKDVDLVPPATDLGQYQVVAAPGLQIVSDDTAARLDAYVRGGGILVLTSQAGIRDTRNHLRPLLPPGVFAEMAGVVIPATVSKSSMTGNLLQGKTDQGVALEYAIRFTGSGASFVPSTVMEGIELRGAEALASFEGGPMTGRPAVTVHRHGQGYVFYVGTDTEEQAFYDNFIGILQERFEIAPLLPVPFGVEVVSRQTSQHTYLFLLNLTALPQRIPLTAPARELISNDWLETEVVLPPLGVAILETDD